MMYVAMWQITEDVTQLIDFSQVSLVVTVGGGGGGGGCTCDMGVSTL